MLHTSFRSWSSVLQLCYYQYYFALFLIRPPLKCSAEFQTSPSTSYGPTQRHHHLARAANAADGWWLAGCRYSFFIGGSGNHVFLLVFKECQPEESRLTPCHRRGNLFHAFLGINRDQGMQVLCISMMATNWQDNYAGFTASLFTIFINVEAIKAIAHYISCVNEADDLRRFSTPSPGAPNVSQRTPWA